MLDNEKNNTPEELTGENHIKNIFEENSLDENVSKESQGEMDQANDKMEETIYSDLSAFNKGKKTEDFVRAEIAEEKDELPSEYKWDYEKYSKMDQFSKEKSNKNKGAVIFASILGALVATFGVAYGGAKFSNWITNLTAQSDLESPESSSSNSAPVLKISDGNASLVSMNQGGFSATSIADKVIPSVVSIVSYARVQSFYLTSVTEVGSGSGVIISDEGYILTNSHVVLMLPQKTLVDAVKVILNDGEEYEAKVIGVDVNTDLAVLKIDAKNLSPAEFGDSDVLKVGEQVFAIGSPMSTVYSGSMTSGIISALNRSVVGLVEVGGDVKYIQTDAAINPGNSGGALVNSKGQVIGINSAKLADIGVEGMGFAIPTATVKTVVDDLIKYGRVRGRALLGIGIVREIDEFTARYNNIKTGLMIGSTTNEDLKGLNQYDILHEINGKQVLKYLELKDELKKYKPGDKVRLVFYRYDAYSNNEERIELEATLIEDKGIIQREEQTQK